MRQDDWPSSLEVEICHCTQKVPCSELSAKLLPYRLRSRRSTSLARVHPLRDQAEDGDGAHEQHGVVELER